MKRIRLFASLFIAIVLAFCGRSFAEKVSAMPAPAAYVDDYAGVLSAGARADTEAMCRQVHDRTKAQIFVVTVNTLEGESVDQFANELFHQWKIGEKKTDRGLLLLFAIDDHKRRIEVGYGLEGILNDAKVGDIGREMVPALRAKNYDEAIEVGVQEVAKVIATDAGVAIDPLPSRVPLEATGPAVADAPAAPAASTTFDYSILFPFLFFGGLFVLFLYIAIRNARRNGFHSGSGTTFSSGSDSGSDSFSSSSSSGSSDSFSGGDGGDSGGAGASGDW